MFNMRDYLEGVWPETLRPIGDGFEKEDFLEWWGRHQHTLSHLHRKIAEQWIHRHWTHSPFDFLPLETLSWTAEAMRGEEILASVHRTDGWEFSPQFDYDTFARPNYSGGPHPTAIALDQGTWDFPIVVLSTPSGIVDRHRGELPNVRLVLVEGHQRHRYLNALHALGKAPTRPHEVFILSSPTVS